MPDADRGARPPGRERQALQPLRHNGRVGPTLVQEQAVAQARNAVARGGRRRGRAWRGHAVQEEQAAHGQRRHQGVHDRGIGRGAAAHVVADAGGLGQIVERGREPLRDLAGTHAAEHRPSAGIDLGIAFRLHGQVQDDLAARGRGGAFAGRLREATGVALARQDGQRQRRVQRQQRPGDLVVVMPPVIDHHRQRRSLRVPRRLRPGRPQAVRGARALCLRAVRRAPLCDRAAPAARRGRRRGPLFPRAPAREEHAGAEQQRGEPDPGQAGPDRKAAAARPAEAPGPAGAGFGIHPSRSLPRRRNDRPGRAHGGSRGKGSPSGLPLGGGLRRARRC